MTELIIALDCGFQRAMTVIEDTVDHVDWYKIGLEGILDYGKALLPYLRSRKKHLMFDVKAWGTPDSIKTAMNTVILDWRPTELITVHPQVARVTRNAVVGSGIRVLSVPRLTSDFNIDDGRVTDFYLDFAYDCDGFVCPVSDIAAARQALTRADPSRSRLIVCPGVRLPGDPADNHATTATPQAAAAAGADFIVVGRPIYTAADPGMVAQGIIREMECTIASGITS